MKQYIKNYILPISVIFLVWLVMEVIFYQIAREAEEAYEKELLKQAKFYNEDIQNTRNWNLKMGGVYVHADNVELNLYTEENYLDTIEGPLVRVNPGWMTRMLSKNLQQDRLEYSVVSNNPINPENKAKGFYAKELSKLEGSTATEALYEIDKENKRLHYMQPIYTMKSCMKCHVEKSYKIGSLRGAMIVDMDVSFTLDRTDKVWQSFYFISILNTLFMTLVLYVILNISRQKFYYLKQTITLEKSLKNKIKKLNQVLKSSELGYWEWDIQTDTYTADAQCFKLLGVYQNNQDEIVMAWRDRVESNDLKAITPIIENAIQKKSPYIVEFRMLHADGHYVWIEASGGPSSFDGDGRVKKLSGVHQEITKRKLLELEQKNNTGYLNTLFEKNPNIIIVTNRGKIVKANDAFFRFFHEYDSLDSFSKEHSCICEFFQHSDSDNFVTNESGQWIEDVMTLREPVVKIVYKKEKYFFATHAKKVYENDALNIIVTFNNITETYRLKKQFEELSIMDELTKIYNRRYFNKVFQEEANRAQRERHSFCFAIMDIDNFKLYNDNYGHDEGDVALKHFADALSAITKRSNEFFFRLGGEEFGLIFRSNSKKAALEYAKNLCQKVEDLNIEHLENLPSKKLTISIGLVYVSPDEAFDLKRIYKQADQALYLAKDRGRNRVEILEDN